MDMIENTAVDQIPSGWKFQQGHSPLLHWSVCFLESDISWMVDQMLGPKYLSIQVTTTLPHWTYFCVDSWRTSYTTRR